MAVNPARLAAAAAQQQAAATDAAHSVLVVAGPGTGKSRTIHDRVRHLASQGVAPQSIFAVSFTRAASTDLRNGIQRNCANIPGISSMSVSTLHSLALRILRRANRLALFAVEPRILDDWEQENVFDMEFSASSRRTKKRCGEIRVHVESVWNTGQAPLPFISSPATPVLAADITSFNNFHGTRGQTYACMLPGEAVKACVDAIAAGNLNPVQLLGIEHMIVDEYQDLSPCDIEFIGQLKSHGAQVFICGDDDQSIYSFRYGHPSGIQQYATNNPGTSPHTLADCFRCSCSVLASADAVLAAHSPPNRLQKNLTSVYTNSNPVVPGVMHRAIFASEGDEAAFIAASCAALLANGVAADRILVLLSSRRAQLKTIVDALVARAVPHDVARQETLADNDEGRFLLSMLRILRDPDDWASHRVLLGLLPGVGPGTCATICDKVVQNNLRFVDLFIGPLPAGVFSTREAGAIAGVVTALSSMSGWAVNDTLSTRLATLLGAVRGNATVIAHIQTVTAQLPQDMTLDELRQALELSSDQEYAELMAAVAARIAAAAAPATAAPPAGAAPAPTLQPAAVPARVRIMTLHTSKGLTADVVFIPGLEESILPGAKRAAFPGQVQEAARLLYVGITRARAACFLSYATQRWLNGAISPQTPSRFANVVGGAFSARTTNTLSAAEIAAITTTIGSM